MATSIFANAIYFIEVLITDVHGDGVDGLTISYRIVRSSDEVQIVTGLLTGIDNGLYKTGISLASPGQYRIEYTTPSGYENSIEYLEVVQPDTVEQVDLPEAEVRHSQIAQSKGSNYLYYLLVDAPPGVQSDAISTLSYCNATVVVKTTGRLDILVSNDGVNWVTNKNIYNSYTGSVSGYGYIKCLTISGYSTVSLCLSNMIT